MGQDASIPGILTPLHKTRASGHLLILWIRQGKAYKVLGIKPGTYLVLSNYLTISTLHCRQVENVHVLLAYDFTCVLLVNPHGTLENYPHSLLFKQTSLEQLSVLQQFSKLKNSHQLKWW